MAATSASDDGLTLPDDAELMKQVRGGSEPAFRQLIDRHARYLDGIAYSLCGHAADAEDLVQETFVAALTSTFRGESAVRTWLVRILVNRAGMLRRSRRRGGGLMRLFGGGDDRSGAAEAATGSAAGGTDARLDLAQMLQALSPEHRQVIVLRELEGMSYEEMADVLGVPRGTIESRLHRARAQLRERYKDYFA